MAPTARMLHFRTNVDDWVACGPDHALRFEPEAGTGGLKPYLHVRRDLWAKVTRALFYDLVELGEERDVDGPAHVRRRVGRGVFRDGAGRQPEGIRLMQSGARRSTSVNVPPVPDGVLRARAGAAHPRRAGGARPISRDRSVRGDLDLDAGAVGQGRREGDQARRGAGARGRARRAGGAAHAAHARPHEPFRADRVSRRQDRSGRREPARRRACARPRRRSGSTRS